LKYEAEPEDCGSTDVSSLQVQVCSAHQRVTETGFDLRDEAAVITCMMLAIISEAVSFFSGRNTRIIIVFCLAYG
jgi:hypothetical protein